MNGHFKVIFMRTYIAIQVVMGLLASIILSSCAGSTGWRFEIGVSPVKQLSNTAELKQEMEKESRK
jgi:hypothetical protein